MQNVTFVATSPTDRQDWVATNFGHFEKAFNQIVPLEDAVSLVGALIQGDEVLFPGLFMKEQFDCHFLYQHCSRN